MLALVWFGHEHLNVLANDFIRGVAEDDFGCVIECLYRASRVDGDDAIDGGVDDRSQHGLRARCSWSYPARSWQSRALVHHRIATR